MEISQERRLAEFKFSSRLMYVSICAMLPLLYYDAGRAAKATPQQNYVKLDPGWWTQTNIPALGLPDGTPIVVFLDPNCPHCAKAYNDVISVSRTYGESVQFYVVPRLLWKYSMMQTEALEVARQNNRYYEMWALQFKKPQAGGMDYDEVAGLFKELGLEIPNLIEKLSAAKDTVSKMRDAAKAAGVLVTPTFFINGEKLSIKGDVKKSLETAITEAMRKKKPGAPVTVKR